MESTVSSELAGHAGYIIGVALAGKEAMVQNAISHMGQADRGRLLEATALITSAIRTLESPADERNPDWDDEVPMQEPYIYVEFDLDYTGGDYNLAGDLVKIPVRILDEECGGSVALAFTKVTGYDAIHIVSYSMDQVYIDDATGEEHEYDEEEGEE